MDAIMVTKALGTRFSSEPLHDRTEDACTISASRCPIQSLKKVF